MEITKVICNTCEKEATEGNALVEFSEYIALGDYEWEETTHYHLNGNCMPKNQKTLYAEVQQVQADAEKAKAEKEAARQEAVKKAQATRAAKKAAAPTPEAPKDSETETDESEAEKPTAAPAKKAPAKKVAAPKPGQTRRGRAVTPANRRTAKR